MIKQYLAHHGIKGMRWGVRRFQRDDGSLTPAGKKRYGSVEALNEDIKDKYGSRENMLKVQAQNREGLEKTGKALGQVSQVARDASNIGANPIKSKTVNKADYSKLSDDELRARINRLNMERNYGELTGDTKRVRTGEDWTRESLQTIGALVGIGAGIATTAYTIVSIKNNKKAGGNT